MAAAGAATPRFNAISKPTRVDSTRMKTEESKETLDTVKGLEIHWFFQLILLLV